MQTNFCSEYILESLHWIGDLNLAKGYQKNVCHVVFKFWLTWGRSLHYFLVLLLLTLNILYLLWMSLNATLNAYLCGAPNRRYIYGSCCKTLVSNCANGQPYGVFYEDICLLVVITTSVLILTILLQFPLGKLAQYRSWDLTIMYFRHCFIWLLNLSKFSQCFGVFIFTIKTL